MLGYGELVTTQSHAGEQAGRIDSIFCATMRILKSLAVLPNQPVRRTRDLRSNS
jgi:hypothetical protein